MDVNVREIMDSLEERITEEGKIIGADKEQKRIAKELLIKGIGINTVIELTDIDREKIEEYEKGMFDEKIRTAKEMSKRGFDLGTIKSITGLADDKIKKLVLTSSKKPPP